MSAELSGVDLARQALVAAREAAKKNGAPRKEKPSGVPARLCAVTAGSLSGSVRRSA